MAKTVRKKILNIQMLVGNSLNLFLNPNSEENLTLPKKFVKFFVIFQFCVGKGELIRGITPSDTGPGFF